MINPQCILILLLCLTLAGQGDPSDEPNEISAAMRNIQQCYQKLCRFIVKKSTDYKNTYSFGGSIVLFNNDLGGKPWLGVLKKADISGCAVEEEKLMQIICNLFFQSKLFSRQCQFMVSTVYLPVLILCLVFDGVYL